MYCPSCRGEYREGFDWCSDCDVALVEALPEEAVQEDDADEEEVKETLAARNLRIVDLGLVLTVAFLRPVASSVLDWWTGEQVHTLTGTLRSFVSNASTEIGALLLLAYILYRQGRSLRSIGLTARASDVAFGVLLCVASSLPLMIPLAAFGGDPRRWFSLLTAVPPLLVLMYVSGALFEELIVRAFMMTEVLELTGNAFLTIASSVSLQTLYHIHYGAMGALGSAVTFLVYALFFWKTRRITPVVLAHFGHNILVSIIR